MQKGSLMITDRNRKGVTKRLCCGLQEGINIGLGSISEVKFYLWEFGLIPFARSKDELDRDHCLFLRFLNSIISFSISG